MLVIPTQAVQTGQQGPYVFLLRPENVVEMRPLRLGRAFGQETVVEEGLQDGDLVVTDGQIRLVPGSRVEVKGRQEPARPSS